MHVGYQYGGAPQRRGATDAVTHADAGTGWLALKWAEDEVRAAQQIEASPVQVRQAAEEQGGKVR